MTTVSITLDNPSLIPSLKKLVLNLKGVNKVVVSSTNIPETPNYKTRAAIQEIRDGKGTRCKNVDELFEQLNNV